MSLRTLTAPFHLPSTRPAFTRPLSFSLRRPSSLSSFSRGGRYQPVPSGDDPPEAPEDKSHGLTHEEILGRQVERARRRLEAQTLDLMKRRSSSYSELDNSSSFKPASDLFVDADEVISENHHELEKAAPPVVPVKPEPVELETVDELSQEEERDVDEITDLEAHALNSNHTSENDESAQNQSTTSANQFDFDLDIYGIGKERVRILEPKLRMTLAELLDESKVVPVSVNGDLEVLITGIQNDHREVNVGDVFICCHNSSKSSTSGLTPLTEADKRGAVAVVADKEINIDETLACKALVIVEDTEAVVAKLAAAFYKRPSENMTVVGVVGSSGITCTTHLIKAMYEASGLRTGMLSVTGHFIYSDNRLESFDTEPSIPDAASVQKIMAKMVHNGTQVVAVDASIDGNGNEIDYDIAVFTNSRDVDDNGSKEEYMRRNARVFSNMVDPNRHKKVVNIDDPNVMYFLSQGSPEVPVVTYSMENNKADVHVIKYRLSLFETEVLVQTPHGILEISSGLLGRENVYSILAAVAVGIAVGVQLEDIVRGIEEVDMVPGRMELIDEEQAYGVVVDHARTPEALSRLLDTVKELGPRRIITVIGCCGEGERGKRPLMTKIAADKSDVVMLTSDNPRNEDPLDILDDMLVGVGWTMQDYLKYGMQDYYPPLKNGHRLFLHDCRNIAVRCAVAMGEEGDIVVVTGKGSKTVQIIGDTEKYFDDRDECRDALQNVYELHKSGIDTSEFPWRLPESH